MTFFRLDPTLYARHKDEVLRLANSFQTIEQRGLSDREIAERLGLDERTVTDPRRRRARLLSARRVGAGH